MANYDSTALLLTWTAPGESDTVGTAARYDIRYALSALQRWDEMVPLDSVPLPRAAGTAESLWVRGLLALTRYSFLLATADSASVWSELSNRAYGITHPGDHTPPAEIGVQWERSDVHSVTLTWTAPGDDGHRGTAVRYEARIRPDGASTWETWAGLPAPQAAGRPERVTLGGLEPGTVYYVNVRAVDESGNAGGWSSTAVGTTVPEDVHWSEEFARPPNGQGTDWPINALVVHQDLLVAGGHFQRAGDVTVKRLAAWDGTAWRALGSGAEGNDFPAVNCLLSDGNALYAGGRFATMDGVSTGCLARWSNGVWSPLGSGLQGEVDDLTLHEGALIAAGIFLVGSTWQSAASWDGTSWTAFPTENYVYLDAVASYRGTLYAGTGDVWSYDGLTYLTRWDGHRWLPALTQPHYDCRDSGCPRGARDLCVLGHRLYVVGQGLELIGNVVVFDGIRWWDQSVATIRDRSEIRTIATWHNAPVIGGSFVPDRTPISCDVAVEIGGSWQPLGTGIDLLLSGVYARGTVRALAEYQGDLYVAGDFRMAGRKPSANIARWRE